MGINPIHWLKTQKSHSQVKLPQGRPPEELRQGQNLDAIEKTDTEELTQNNEFYKGIAFSAQLNQRLHREVVKLVVEDREIEGDQYIVVRCHNAVLGQREQLYTKPIKPPKVSFDTGMRGEDITVKMLQIQEIMQMFSEENPLAQEIRNWLIELKKKQQLSYVIINDRTDFEIPWEMLQLELEKNDYLGASFTTVRWQDIPYPNNLEIPSDWITLEVEPSYCCGNIVAYVNAKGLPEVIEEKKILEQFHHNCFEDVSKFFNHLKRINSEVSLVFIASHGFFGENLSQVTLGEKNDFNQQISLTKLYRNKLDFLAKSGSIVFLNACHSGRLQRDRELNIFPPDLRTGFATFFLKRGARGVIGTLSKVADKYAAKITQNFFAEYQQNPQLSVATILRNLRAQAAQQLKTEENNENRYLFLFTFMYVYYGNPMTKLQLTKFIES